MRQLYLVHNSQTDADTIVRVDNGVVVSTWPATPTLIQRLHETEYAGDWDVQDADGLATEDGDRYELHDFGATIVMELPIVGHSFPL